MQALVVGPLRWLARHIVHLVLIVVVLILGQFIWSQWKAWHTTLDETARLVDAERRLRVSLEDVARQINDRAATQRNATEKALAAHIAALEADIARLRAERQRFGGLKPLIAGRSIGEAQLEVFRIERTIEFLEKERTWLHDLLMRLQRTRSAEAQRREADRLRGRHADLYARWQAVQRQCEALEQDHAVMTRVPGTAENRQLQELQERRTQLASDARRADADYRRHLELIKGSRAQSPVAAAPLPPEAVEDALQPFSARIAVLREQAHEYWFAQVVPPIQRVFPTAVWILLGGVILTPFVIKVLFFFVLAPLAARRPPVRLLPGSGGALSLDGGRSSVSCTVTVDAEHELLVHSEFLQSASIRCKQTTRWLLNRSFALTSLAARMVGLTCVRCDAPETVVITASGDPLAEVAIVDLPARSSVVMQPHNLVGVIQRRDAPLHITAHWRLTSLHAWLTLQLRYLALHGPAKLIVQGGRGVRLERAAGGRAINQAATIGFSGNVLYSTHRFGAFHAYLRGQQELLSDCFGSAESAGRSEGTTAGFFIYQERPLTGHSAGVAGRRLEGLTDSMLKVLGI